MQSRKCRVRAGHFQGETDLKLMNFREGPYRPSSVTCSLLDQSTAPTARVSNPVAAPWRPQGGLGGGVGPTQSLCLKIRQLGQRLCSNYLCFSWLLGVLVSTSMTRGWECQDSTHAGSSHNCSPCASPLWPEGWAASAWGTEACGRRSQATWRTQL